MTEWREGRNYFYRITERSELFHRLLRSGNVIKLFFRVSGKRLKQNQNVL